MKGTSIRDLSFSYENDTRLILKDIDLEVFGLILEETCTMALVGGVLGSAAAWILMNPVIQMLREAFKLSPSVWTPGLALLCALAGVALAGILGFVPAFRPAWQSASLDPQTAITRGELG